MIFRPREQVEPAGMNRRIMRALRQSAKATKDLSSNIPFMPGSIACGSFLGDLHDEEGAKNIEKRSNLNSKDGGLQHLANIYGILDR